MPFAVKDCTLIARMGGVPTAITLRELRERIRFCSVDCLFHHFCETVVRPGFDYPEFRNDFAVWAARHLSDLTLAERLGAINPYRFQTLEQVREQVLELIDDRLAEVPHAGHLPAKEEFRFMSASTVVFETGTTLERPEDLVSHIATMSYGSVYYHFVEARRRTEGMLDDFSAWLTGFGQGVETLLASLRTIDFYYLTLPELKSALIVALSGVPTEATSE